MSHQLQMFVFGGMLLSVLPGFSGTGAWYDSAWRYRRTITINHTGVASADLKDFPVLICLSELNLRSAKNGGHVARAQGEDILFTSSDGTTKLNHEIEGYDPANGTLVAWVKALHLAASTDTVLYAYYGNPASGNQQDRAVVWDSDYRMVLHLSGRSATYVDSTVQQNKAIGKQGAGPGAGLIGGSTRLGGRGGSLEISKSPGLNFDRGITVEAWVNSESRQTEGIQSIVSQWSPMSALETFEGYDASNTVGLNTVGFFGAVFDGRYVYFVPQHDGKMRHGRVLRYDTHEDFRSPNSWSGYDAGKTSGLNTKGYYGGAFDGRYVYFSPRTDGQVLHSRVLRYDTDSDFTASKSWQAYDAGDPVSHQGAAFDGRYVYFPPGSEGKGKSGKVLRYDTKGGFTTQASWATYDAGHTSGLETVDYDGAVFDGRYMYFSPLSTVPLRYDTKKEFKDITAWEAYDSGLMPVKTCVGAVFDGRYVYYVPYGENSAVVRYDTSKEFRDWASWSAYSYLGTTGNTHGYDGGAFDGRYVYFIPFWDPTAPKDKGFHGTLLRYDTQGEFNSPSSWTAHDAGETSGLRTIGFNGGAFDGRYLYCSPWRENIGPGGLTDIVPHGRVLRYDTIGANGSFSLRYTDYGHNGGLGGSLPGATFILNTDKGALSVRANRILPPGWHHIAGVYDGKAVGLYVDGSLANEQSGIGTIQASTVPIAIGRILNGEGYFTGRIDEVRISSAARSAGWLKTQNNNQKSPGSFYRLEAEETRGAK